MIAEGAAGIIGIRRDLVQDAIDQVARAFREGIDGIQMQAILAHLETQGYVIIAPSDHSSPAEALRTRDREIARLRATVAHLRTGGSIPPQS